jgi:hypothetical protein
LSAGAIWFLKVLVGLQDPHQEELRLGLSFVTRQTMLGLLIFLILTNITPQTSVAVRAAPLRFIVIAALGSGVGILTTRGLFLWWKRRELKLESTKL